MTEQAMNGARQGAARALGGLRAALTVLTRIPVGSAPLRAEAQRWAPAFFPVVGAFVGAITGLVYLAFLGVGALPSAALAVASGLLLTGALHEDGLADTADALGGASTRERLFDILKDSRTGSFGAAAVAITVLLRASLLAALGADGGWALVLVHATARLAPVWLMTALPYVTDPKTRKNAALERPTRERALLASSAPLALLFVGLGLGWLSLVDVLVFVALGALSTMYLGHRFHLRAGGYTGDFLGATEQVVECALLLALALVKA
jgi:adenosylcobinamide-GDP ribazoletransferase